MMAAEPSDTTPLLFLSHAGHDSTAALRLAEIVEATTAAKEAGLRVWVDKDDLRAGTGWQAQLEELIELRSTAFAVYVGKSPVDGWVESEMRLALSRARSDRRYKFMRIFSPDCPGSVGLPGFARQYQAVRDIENNSKELSKLVAAVLNKEPNSDVALVNDPFPGLQAFEERDARLFFGREDETYALVQSLRRTPLLMIVGDSGAGKSSLVKAGLLPAFRNGALIETIGNGLKDDCWHVIETRPSGRPFGRLAESTSDVAAANGKNPETRSRIRDDINSVNFADFDRAQFEKVRGAIRESAPVGAHFLIAVDQFEELFVASDRNERAAYIQLIDSLCDLDDSTFRVVMTMRNDYYNLCSEYPTFYDRLEGRDSASKYIVRRISEDGLRRCITEPLRLAGVTGDTVTAYTNDVLSDLNERPGDLALLQVALYETWQRKNQFGGNLSASFATVGRVAGALATAANDVINHELTEGDRGLADSVFIRLARLGDTGGPVRRIATRDEFDDSRWKLIQKLATRKGGRLLLIGGSEIAQTVEIAHEALVTQWPRYHRLITDAAQSGDKRRLDAVIEKAIKGREELKAGQKVDRLTGNALDEACMINDRHENWLAGYEKEFIRVSQSARLKRFWLERAAIICLVVLAMFAAGFGWYGFDRGAVANQEARKAQTLTWHMLIAAAVNELEGGQAKNALVIARRAVDAEGLILNSNEEGLIALLSPYVTTIWSRLFSPKSDRALTAFRPSIATAVLRSAVFLNHYSSTLNPHGRTVTHALFSPKGDQVLTTSRDGTVHLSRTTDGGLIAALTPHVGAVEHALFSLKGDQVLTRSGYGTVHLSRTTDGGLIAALKPHVGVVWNALFSPKGDQVLTASDDDTVHLSRATDGGLIAALNPHGRAVWNALFNPKGDQVLTTSDDGTVHLSHTLPAIEDARLYAEHFVDTWIISTSKQRKYGIESALSSHSTPLPK